MHYEKNQLLDQLNEKINELPDYPDLSKCLTKDWSNWACTADFHIPFIHIPLFKKFIKECVHKGISKLVVAGDYYDMNAFQKFFAFSKVSWPEEKKAAQEVLDIMKEVFDEIVFMASNHEARWLKALACGEGDIHNIYELIGMKDKSSVTVKNKIIVKDWFITHPKTARKTPLSLARDLSAIYQNKNIIVTHAHMQALARDPSGTRWLVDLGMMGDPNKFEYKCFNVTPHYAWNPGFMILINNEPYLYWG